MLECKRILCNKKALVIFAILVLLHGVFFVFQCNDAKTNTLVGEELEDYVDGYPEYIQTVQENIEAMQENSLFADKDSFVYRNLIKTGKDYERLNLVKPVLGENRGILTVMNFQLTGFVLLLIGVYIVMCFMLERQKGLHLLVRCTGNGRMRLSLQRIGILALGLLAAAVILFGSTLFISSIVFPHCDLLRPVQSVPEFCGVISHSTIGGYLLQFLLKKVIGCFVTCLLLYFCMSVFRTSLCVLAFLLLFLGEYLLYNFIIPTEPLGFLKYFNLYTYVFCQTEYATYFNLNLGGRPFLLAKSADLMILGATVMLAALCLIRYARQYPQSECRSLRFVEKMSAIWSRHKPMLSLTFWELKKVFVSQKGILVILASLYLAYSASTEANYLDFRSEYITHWYTEFAGEITSERVTAIAEKKKSLEDKKEMLEKSLERQNELLVEHLMKGYEIGKIADNIDKLEKAIAECKKQIKGITIVLTQAEEGLSYSEKTGRALHLMDTGPYELLLKTDKRTIMRNYLYVLLAVVLSVSGVMACEKSSHMEKVLHTVYRGRLPVLLRKIVIMVCVAFLCTLSIHLIQFFQIRTIFSYPHMEYLVQSIPCVRSFALPITIKQYLIFLYGFRVFISVLLGSVVMFYSSRFSRITTIALGVFSLIVPMGLLIARF